jgi:hypothetical protein
MNLVSDMTEGMPWPHEAYDALARARTFLLDKRTLTLHELSRLVSWLTFSYTNEGCIRPTMHHTEMNDYMLRNPKTRAS